MSKIFGQFYKDKPGVVYRPGGPTTGVFYSSFAEAYAALNDSSGERVLYIDDSVTSPAVIPAGTYDFTNVILAGGRTATITSLSFDDGVQILNLRKITGPMFVGGNNTVTAVCDVSSGANQLLDLGPGVFISNAGTKAIWEVTTVSLNFLFQAAVQFQSGTIVNLLTGGSFGGTAFNTSGIGANTVTDDGSGTLNVATDASSNLAAQAGFTGTLTSSNVDSAPKVAYVPAVPTNYLTTPTEVKGALDQLASRAPGDAIVWQPGGVDSQNLYSSWADALAAAQAAKIATIFVDDSITSPAVIPAGAYDLTNIVLHTANPRNVNAAVQVADGASFTNFNQATFIDFEFLNTAIIETVSDVRTLRFFTCTLTANGSAPVWEFAVSNSIFGMVDFNRIPTGATELVNIQSGITLINALFGGSTVGNDTFSGDATTVLVNAFQGSASSFGTQAGFAGTLVPLLNSNVANIAYTPGDANDWISVPTTAQEGLDNLAEQAVQEKGQDVLAGGTVTVPSTHVTANSKILVTPNSPISGTLYTDNRVPGVSFDIVSTNGADTCGVDWVLFN